MFSLFIFLVCCVVTQSDESSEDEILPHHQFECPLDVDSDIYETEFDFLSGLGTGFVHLEPERIYFEYYFPKTHWVAFATADQIIENTKSQCTPCYFNNYYPQRKDLNDSNLYPKCIDECLAEVIFVGTVNTDEQNPLVWSIIEFQIAVQSSQSLHKKMYRIPPVSELLEIWGYHTNPYRENTHFEVDFYESSVGKKYVHAIFWRDYDFKPFGMDSVQDINYWVPWTTSPNNSFCFLSIGSYEGGQYPYNNNAFKGTLPGFYIDTQHFANIHCFALKDTKVECAQDWPWLNKEQNNESFTSQTNSKSMNNNTRYKQWVSSVEFENNTFETVIKYNDFTFVNFCFQRSMDCRLQPIWFEAEQKLNTMTFHDKHGNIVLSKLLHIDCDLFPNLCFGIDIHSLRIYNKNCDFEEYDGEATVDAILEYLQSFIDYDYESFTNFTSYDVLDDYYDYDYADYYDYGDYDYFYYEEHIESEAPSTTTEQSLPQMMSKEQGFYLFFVSLWPWAVTGSFVSICGCALYFVWKRCLCSKRDKKPREIPTEGRTDPDTSTTVLITN